MGYRIYVGAILSLAAATPCSAADKPHVLLVMTDDMGWMDLGCQGNPKLRTPRIDALAGEGVRFTNAYASAPVLFARRGPPSSPAWPRPGCTSPSTAGTTRGSGPTTEPSSRPRPKHLSCRSNG